MLFKQMHLAKKEQQNLKRELEDLNKAMEKRLKEIQNLKGEISQARINLKEFITRYFSDLIRQVAGTSLETFNDFVKREIGNEGININTRVQNAFERETQGIFNEIAKIGTSFNADRSFFEKHAGTFGKVGTSFLKQSGCILIGKYQTVEQDLTNLINVIKGLHERLSDRVCGKICGHRFGFQIQTMGCCKIGRKPKQSFTAYRFCF